MNFKHLILGVAFAFAAVLPFGVSAQAPQMQQLPVDTAVRYGKLPNGLTYIVRHNANPKNRANYYIAQRVGSILEDDNQSGLAHFLEHMAFNGTKNFPDKNLISFLERIGCRFGADLNAYTAFDETVYTIMDAPTEKKDVVDSCLLIMHDWSNNISLVGKEIDEERGVIHEEWRSRDNGQLRNLVTLMEKLLPNNKYAKRMPIGSMDVVDHFPHKRIRDYYKKWYRPDLQCVIVVGDIDPDYVVKELTRIFKDVPKPENAAERYYVPVEDNDKPLIGIATDPEVTATTVQLMYKHDVLPNEYKNTIAGVSMNYMEAVVSQMLNERLMAYAMKPNAPFLQAGAYDGSYMGVAKTKEAFNFIAICKNGGAVPALEALVSEAQKVKQFGFTQSEYDRAKKSLITSYENSYKERAKRTNSSYIEEYKSFYLDGGYIPGIEYEYNMMQQLAANIPLDVVNQYAAGLITDKNVAIGITGPKKDDIKYPTEAEVETIFENACKAKVEAYKEEVSDEKLLDKEPKGGKIVSEKKNQKYGVTELTLNNGIKVYLKKTDFKDDTIIMSAEKKGGKSLYGPKDFTNLKVLGEVMDLGGLGKFDAIALQKALTGRTAATSCVVSLHKDMVSGSSSVVDFETMLQLLYLESTARRADKDAFDAFMQRKEVALKNAANNPMSALQDSVPSLLYNNDPRVTPLTLSDLKDINYNRIMEIARERFANYEGAKFFFIGNLDEATMKPLIAKYIGALPVDKKHPNVTNEKVQVAMAKGQKDLFFKKDFDTPISYILDVIPCKLPFTQKNAILMDVLGAILSQEYTATIREQEGGAYSVGAYATLQSDPKGEAFIQVFFPTDPTKAEAMNKLVYKAIEDIAKNGPNREYLKKTLLNNAKVHEENQRKNGYWLGHMINYYVEGFDWVSDYDKVMKEITPEAVQNLVKEILKQGNKLQMRVTSFKTEKDLKK